MGKVGNHSAVQWELNVIIEKVPNYNGCIHT